MTLKKQNPWKILSLGLLGIITIGLLAPVSAAPPSGNSDSQLEELFNLVNEVLLSVQGIDTDLDELSGNVTAIKIETDKIQTVKDDVATIKTTTNAIKTETDKIQTVKDDVTQIKSDVTSLVSSGSSTFRITHSFDDGDDDEYNGSITINRVSGSGVYLIERLYLCDLYVGEDTGAGDGLWVSYSVDGEPLENPDSTVNVLNKFDHSSPSTINPGCLDLLYADEINGQISLAGDGANNVVIHLQENEYDGVEGDDDGAEIVAYISGLSDPSDIEITSTTGNS